jgi:hypothetical protein
MYVTITDVEGDGPDTQGMAGFQGDLLTNVGTAPVRSFSATNEGTIYNYFITDPLWSSAAMAPPMLGGFGMGFVSDLGTSSGDDAIGIGAFMPLVWDADTSTAAGVQPYALQGVGYGTPSTAVDSGGNALSPAYGTVRAKWYLLAGSISVPAGADIYTVEFVPGQATQNVIRAGLNLGADITDGYVESASLTSTIQGGSFSFQVPEPAALSALLFAGAALTTRRRRVSS